MAYVIRSATDDDKAIIAKINSILGDTQAKANEFQNSVKNDGDWLGDSREAYVEISERFSQKIDEFSQLLAQMMEDYRIEADEHAADMASYRGIG